MHTCMHTHKHTYIHTYVYDTISANMWCLDTTTPTRTHTRAWVWVCVYIWSRQKFNVLVQIRTRTHTHAHVCVCVHACMRDLVKCLMSLTQILTHTHMCVCVCVYLHVRGDGGRAEHVYYMYLVITPQSLSFMNLAVTHPRSLYLWSSCYSNCARRLGCGLGTSQW